MPCGRASGTTPWTVPARVKPRAIAAFPTDGLGDPVDRVWTTSVTRCGRTCGCVRGQSTLFTRKAMPMMPESRRRRGNHRVAEERIAALAIEFIAYCFRRRSVGWPQLYDEMCYVAGNRLYKGMGYDELKDAGLDFTLSGLARTSRVAAEVTSSMRREAALAS